MTLNPPKVETRTTKVAKEMRLILKGQAFAMGLITGLVLEAVLMALRGS